MTYAVIRLGGKQFKVSQGDKIELERHDDPGVEVLMLSDGDKLHLGQPVLTEFEVSLKKIEDKRGRKIRVARFKSKSRYRKVKGHKQPLSVFEVESIGKAGAKKAAPKPKAEAKEEAKVTEPKKQKPEEKEKAAPKAKTETPAPKTAWTDKPKKEKKPATKKAAAPKKEAKTKKAEAPKKRGRPKKVKEE